MKKTDAKTMISRKPKVGSVTMGLSNTVCAASFEGYDYTKEQINILKSHLDVKMPISLTALAVNV